MAPYMPLPREDIQQVVESFYRKALRDAMIGFHFRHIQDLSTHIPRLTSFWELQLNGQTTHPLDHPFSLIPTHQKMGIKRGQLDRWVVLFKQTLQETFSNQNDKSEQWAQIWSENIDRFRLLFTRHLQLSRS